MYNQSRKWSVVSTTKSGSWIISSITFSSKEGSTSDSCTVQGNRVYIYIAFLAFLKRWKFSNKYRHSHRESFLIFFSDRSYGACQRGSQSNRREQLSPWAVFGASCRPSIERTLFGPFIPAPLDLWSATARQGEPQRSTYRMACGKDVVLHG